MKNLKKTAPKLTLSKETLRKLSDKQLKDIAGGPVEAEPAPSDWVCTLIRCTAF